VRGETIDLDTIPASVWHFQYPLTDRAG